MDKMIIGKIGEKYAENFLYAQNYKILTRNFRCKYGEIDIIAIDNINQRQLAFVEVKTRTTVNFGEPQNAITNSKKQRIIKSALYFFSLTRKKLPLSWRMDVIGIKLDRKMKLREITHLKNIFNG
jgi:putative endonuclease